MKAPAFQFYAGDWLSSQRVALMSLEEEGGYIRLLAFCWQHGSIPDDPEKIARLIGKGASTTLATTLATMFEPGGNGLVNRRLEEVRLEQEAWRAKSSEGGKKSAEKRRIAKEAKENATKPQPPLEGWLPNGANQTATLQSSPSPSIPPNPQGGFSLSPAPTGEADNSPLMIRLGKFFNRRATTRWSAAERKALKKLTPIDPEDIELLERYYLEEIPQGDDYRRRDLETLLNNWTKEIDRATSHFATPAIR